MYLPGKQYACQSRSRGDCRQILILPIRNVTNRNEMCVDFQGKMPYPAGGGLTVNKPQDSSNQCAWCRGTITWTAPRNDGARTGVCACGEWFASAALQRTMSSLFFPSDEEELADV